MDSLAPLMHHDPDRSWITDPDPDRPIGTHPNCSSGYYGNSSKKHREQLFHFLEDHEGLSHFKIKKAKT